MDVVLEMSSYFPLFLLNGFFSLFLHVYTFKKNGTFKARHVNTVVLGSNFSIGLYRMVVEGFRDKILGAHFPNQSS